MTSMDHHYGAADIVRHQATGARETDPLPQLLAQLVERAGHPTLVERAASRPWASALFEGRRHLIRLRMGGDDIVRRDGDFRDGLAEAQWSLSGHFVADIHVDDGGVDADGAWLDLSALTIRDW